MNIVVDRNIPYAESAFGTLGELKLVETGEFTPESIRCADAIVIRSETKVDRSLLDGSCVKFVGTATIGTDHIDVEYLRAKGIILANAPGCNANSVKEYIVAALLYLSANKGFSLKDKTIGVVGVGNIGSKVVKVAEALGMNVLQNDPPRARVEGNNNFVPLDELMSADVITLHVPLTKSGEYATYHLFDEERISKMKKGVVFINTSRGSVVDTLSIKRAIVSKKIAATVIDVWENEPTIDTEFLSAVTIGTPHIAGYSLEGRTNAVRIIREAFCNHFGITSFWELPKEISPQVMDISVTEEHLSPEEILHRIVSRSYDISYDSRNLARILTISPPCQGKYFTKLRTEYRIRREFSNYMVHLPMQYKFLKDVITTLGFKCVIHE